MSNATDNAANDSRPAMLFEPGDIVATPGALDAITRVAHAIRRQPEQVAGALVGRHLSGDWGDLDPEDKDTNDGALEYGDRILSAYYIGDSQTPVKIWVITEADRSVTTLLLPSDY